MDATHVRQRSSLDRGAGGRMTMKFKRVAPYADDELNLPVPNVDEAIPYYVKNYGFKLVSRKEEPCRSAILERDNIRIGLAENGGDPTQEGC
jgi:hypothetical protein